MYVLIFFISPAFHPTLLDHPHSKLSPALLTKCFGGASKFWLHCASHIFFTSTRISTTVISE
jgi:hypothetical protein